MTIHHSPFTSHANRAAIGYIRVSTGKQADHGVSLEAQRAKIEAYCLLHDLELLEVLQDESSAKSIDGRPAMKRLLKLARSRAVDAVVTVKLDRMFRNTVEAITVIPELQALGVATHIMDINGVSLDTSTPMGSFFLTMAAAFSDLERKQIAERTRTALRHKRDAGDQYSAIAPFGWVFYEGKVIPHLTESKAVEMIFILKQRGLSNAVIRDKMDSSNMKPRHARLWSASSISKILSHPLNIERFTAHAAHSSELHGNPSPSVNGADRQEGSHVRHH
ncbi:recombinase family protein [Mariprofundus ferrooxydans]|uniref:recombinase family protein n=1 Tax=Mariprofundus ferrooxydans TaxID=314344 RepID=UPI001430A884|nr:recombinase family protein [Mariprofundus ferrooxydans]